MNTASLALEGVVFPRARDLHVHRFSFISVSLKCLVAFSPRRMLTAIASQVAAFASRSIDSDAEKTRHFKQEFDRLSERLRFLKAKPGRLSSDDERFIFKNIEAMEARTLKFRAVITDIRAALYRLNPESKLAAAFARLEQELALLYQSVYRVRLVLLTSELATGTTWENDVQMSRQRTLGAISAMADVDTDDDDELMQLAASAVSAVDARANERDPEWSRRLANSPNF